MSAGLMPFGRARRLSGPRRARLRRLMEELSATRGATTRELIVALGYRSHGQLQSDFDVLVRLGYLARAAGLGRATRVLVRFGPGRLVSSAQDAQVAA